LGVENLHFKRFCRMWNHSSTPCSARVQKVDWSRLVIVHMTRAACRELLWCTDNKRSLTNQWIVRRVLLVSWLVISSTLLASIASHTSTSNVDGPLAAFYDSQGYGGGILPRLHTGKAHGSSNTSNIVPKQEWRNSKLIPHKACSHRQQMFTCLSIMVSIILVF
jgi:hypothetical protein